MRRFSSYGPINTKSDYYAPRKELIERAYSRLTGENPDEDGYYITVWAPRQCGKTWVMQEAMQKIKESAKYEVGIITMERAKEVKEEEKVLKILIEKLQNTFERSLPPVKEIDELPTLFTKQYFQEPVILIMDEFDALEEVFINRFAGIFRDMYISRTNEGKKTVTIKRFYFMDWR
jgi:Cdc6-like AAA superfamily ATPase